ncbi:MAG: MFS transporter, partial [Pseudohongiella sp.]|nr:MFS transporter [Pseudohongiella sp.]
MSPLPRTRLLAYGGLGLPLAFAALPLYVHLAPFYSGVISLSLLGAILLALRFLDAAIDPLIGALFDRFPHPRTLVALSLPVLGLGWIGVFTLPEAWPVVPWLIGMLTLTTVGYSLATVVHTSWGARLSNVPHERTRLFAAREGF